MMRNKRADLKVAVASLSSPLEVGADRADAIVDKLAKQISANGYDTVNLGVINTIELAESKGREAAQQLVDVVAFAPACWFEDYLALDFLEECSVPALFWPQPGMETGALCGTQQVTACLKQLAQPFLTVFGDVESDGIVDRVGEYLDAVFLRKRMRRSKIGFAGQRLHGMTHTAPNEFMLKKAIGSRVVPLDLPSILKRVGEIEDGQVAERWQDVVSCAAECCVKAEDGLYSMKAYMILKQLVEEHRLDALTIGCYPHLMGKVCLAASLLADENIPFACEGDTNGAVGQLILSQLTGQPTHHTDWLDPLPGGTVIFTHCGSGSFSLAEDQTQICLNSVRLMGQGVCALFPAKTGPVTLVSLIPVSDGYQCAVLEGMAEKAGMVFPGNPVNVRFELAPGELIDWISDNGIGHHWMIGYGHVKDRIKTWSSLCEGVKILQA